MIFTEGSGKRGWDFGKNRRLRAGVLGVYGELWSFHYLAGKYMVCIPLGLQANNPTVLQGVVATGVADFLPHQTSSLVANWLLVQHFIF